MNKKKALRALYILVHFFAVLYKTASSDRAMGFVMNVNTRR